MSTRKVVLNSQSLILHLRLTVYLRIYYIAFLLHTVQYVTCLAIFNIFSFEFFFFVCVAKE